MPWYRWKVSTKVLLPDYHPLALDDIQAVEHDMCHATPLQVIDHRLTEIVAPDFVDSRCHALGIGSTHQDGELLHGPSAILVGEGCSVDTGLRPGKLRLIGVIRLVA